MTSDTQEKVRSSVRLDPNTHRVLNDLAEKDKRSVNFVINDVIEKGLKLQSHLEKVQSLITEKIIKVQQEILATPTGPDRDQLTVRNLTLQELDHDIKNLS